MLHPPEAAIAIESHDLPKRTADLLDHSMVCTWLSPKGPPPNRYVAFLSADVLHEGFGDMFRLGLVDWVPFCCLKRPRSAATLFIDRPVSGSPDRPTDRPEPPSVDT